MTIANDEITVVVQGPVQSLPERPQDEGITQRCLASVRTHLPGARIVLSTWPNQELAGLDYDELVINEDPGPNIIGYHPDGTPRKENTNRQIVSSAGGLRRVTTRFAMKLRADNYLTGTGFKQLQQRYPKRCAEYQILRERIVVVNTLARKFYRGRRVAFVLSDFFGFGLAEDVLNLWDLPLLPDFPYDPALEGALQHHGAPDTKLDVDQVLAQRFINKNRPHRQLDLRNVYDKSGGKVRQSDRFFANNFVVASAEQVGLGLSLKFTAGRQAKFSSRATCLQTSEWQLLYRRYCDPDFGPIDDRAQLAKVWAMRLLVLPMKRAGDWWRDRRERRRYRRVVRRGAANSRPAERRPGGWSG